MAKHGWYNRVIFMMISRHKSHKMVRCLLEYHLTVTMLEANIFIHTYKTNVETDSAVTGNRPCWTNINLWLGSLIPQHIQEIKAIFYHFSLLRYPLTCTPTRHISVDIASYKLVCSKLTYHCLPLKSSGEWLLSKWPSIPKSSEWDSCWQLVHNSGCTKVVQFCVYVKLDGTPVVPNVEQPQKGAVDAPVLAYVKITNDFQ